MPEVDLAYCMSLPPRKAIDYLKHKGYAITWNWEELWQDAQAQAFTVAKAMRLDILQDIRDAVEKTLSEGKTFSWFEKELTPVLQAKGWWGKQEHIDQDTGEISQVQLGSPWRLQTIYRTNLQTAYMAGRWQAQIENIDDRPYWMYVAILDGKTRPSHRAMNGKVFRHDDPIWQYLYPPNGWGCRCRVVALSADDVAKRGLAVETSAGKLGSLLKRVSEKTGEMREVATFRAVDPLTHREIVMSPDVGWSYNPGAAAWVPDLGRYTGDLAKLARKELP
ncbi:minor capsid protein [Laribacter hongkongensis]|uniref:phage head morphogenesis protein n=1 Tax=Laribacter hongkongensis TaxID=168471 RepID=UPI001EFDAE82|nr:phage minor head protein [Laribacter hongkongensis]MCG8991455.1 minor capsid protein [Laribacter hongkongensis]MCG8997711.1 minor capsid protein [Laribacter hongkongensis]MCG9001263.1 minor capsid protein [Laribacter hongkongensis]MCG9003041.1 minor capsid protein [Laribacter hongkongensis]MCG9007471.1 minor capsid protein [Laribacter hongkongensis]